MLAQTAHRPGLDVYARKVGERDKRRFMENTNAHSHTAEGARWCAALSAPQLLVSMLFVRGRACEQVEPAQVSELKRPVPHRSFREKVKSNEQWTPSDCFREDQQRVDLERCPYCKHAN